MYGEIYGTCSVETNCNTSFSKTPFVGVKNHLYFSISY